MGTCACTELHPPRRIVLTGGPGAGKTAVLEMMRKTLCEHVKVVPEAASIVFGGGFPRTQPLEARRAAQRAIFFMQREQTADGKTKAFGVKLNLTDKDGKPVTVTGDEAEILSPQGQSQTVNVGRIVGHFRLVSACGFVVSGAVAFRV